MVNSPRPDSVVDALLRVIGGETAVTQYDDDDTAASLIDSTVIGGETAVTQYDDDDTAASLIDSTVEHGTSDHVTCDSPPHSVVESLFLEEDLLNNEKENEAQEGNICSSFNTDANKEMVMIALHYDNKKDGVIPLPIRNTVKSPDFSPPVVMESMVASYHGDTISSAKFSSYHGDPISTAKSSSYHGDPISTAKSISNHGNDSVSCQSATKPHEEDDAQYLYVTQETLDKLITSANSDQDDVYLSCQEVETQHGKVFMMTESDKESELQGSEKELTRYSPSAKDTSTVSVPRLEEALFPDEGSAIGESHEVEIGESHVHEVEISSVPLDVTEHMINAVQSDNDEDFTSFTRPCFSDSSSAMTLLDKQEDGDTQCLICDTRFPDSTSLRLHCAYRHSSGKQVSFQCWECQLTFKFPRLYMEHKEGLHKETANVCPVCGVLVSTERSLLQHLNSHLQRVSYKCDCCDRRFGHPESLKEHIKTKHQSLTVDEGLFCEKCGKEFKHKRSLVRHVKMVHLKSRVQCDMCHKTYSSISALYHHQRTKHANITFHCGSCSKVYKSVSAVKKHEKLMHQDVGAHRVTPTEKVYNYSQYVSKCDVTLSRNTTTHITCMFCSAMFFQHDTYSKHCAKFHKGEMSSGS